MPSPYFKACVHAEVAVALEALRMRQAHGNNYQLAVEIGIRLHGTYIAIGKDTPSPQIDSAAVSEIYRWHPMLQELFPPLETPKSTGSEPTRPRVGGRRPRSPFLRGLSGDNRHRPHRSEWPYDRRGDHWRPIPSRYNFRDDAAPAGTSDQPPLSHRPRESHDPPPLGHRPRESRDPPPLSHRPWDSSDPLPLIRRPRESRNPPPLNHRPRESRDPRSRRRCDRSRSPNRLQ